MSDTNTLYKLKYGCIIAYYLPPHISWFSCGVILSQIKGHNSSLISSTTTKDKNTIKPLIYIGIIISHSSIFFV